MKYILSFLVRPIVQQPLLFLFIVLLLSIPGWLFITNFQENPIVKTICWFIFITGLPALISWFVCIVNNKLLTFVTCFICLFLFSINIFLIFNFDSMISPWILLLCHETNKNESTEFINNYFFSSHSIFAYLLTLIIIILFVITKHKKYSLRINHPKIIAPIISIWLIVGFIQLLMLCNMFTKKTQYELQLWYQGKAFYAIENTLSNLIYSIYHLSLTTDENNIAINTCIKASKTVAKCIDSDSLDIVVIIGESFSKHHASLYGYGLETTPNMKKEQLQGNLFVFTDAITPYNMTTLAVKNMTSTNSISLGQYWTDYPPFTIIFKQAGFNVAMWDNQKAIGNVSFHDFSISSYLHSKKMTKLAYDVVNEKVYDDDLEFVNYTFQHKINKRHTLTIYHLLGQHLQAKCRYPNNKENTVFTANHINRPDLNTQERQSIAEYDNATRYNDYTISKIFNYYRNRCAAIVYLSDHGEEVYDYRHVIGRTHEPEKNKLSLTYQYQIPLMIWCSDRYKQRNPDIVSKIENAINKPFISDNLPHIVFTLGSIKTPYYCPEKDLLNNRYQCGKRVVQNTTDYDELIR